MFDLETNLRREMVRHLVSRNMFCVVTGDVLDMDTCVVLLDKDGDPKMVLSQAGWEQTCQHKRDTLEKMGVTVDPRTVRVVA